MLSDDLPCILDDLDPSLFDLSFQDMLNFPPGKGAAGAREPPDLQGFLTNLAESEGDDLRPLASDSDTQDSDTQFSVSSRTASPHPVIPGEMGMIVDSIFQEIDPSSGLDARQGTVRAPKRKADDDPDEDDDDDDETSFTLHRPCKMCRTSKVRCDRRGPVCGRCKRHGFECGTPAAVRRGRPTRAMVMARQAGHKAA